MRTRTLAVLSLALAVALVGATPVRGHTAPLDGQHLVWGSRYVVVATVVGKATVRRGAVGLIVTQYRLAVEEGLRGDPPHELTVEVAGGTMDGETHASCLTVHLTPGGRYVLFVNDPAHPGFSTFTGAQQGVVQDPGSSLGQPIAIASLSGGFAEIAGSNSVSFDELVDRLRAFIVRTEALPAPPAPAAVVRAVPLPAKRFVRKAEAVGFDATPVVPVDLSPSRGPEAPARPDVTVLDASYGERLERPEIPPASFSYGRQPPRYIVWNQLVPAFAPWSPRDQGMMARWNSYGDIHRVSANPTGTWDYGNGVYDMTGFPPNQDMIDAFGRAWNPGELGVCFSRWIGNGPIIESDISVNPSAPWTTNIEVGTRPDPAGTFFDHVVLHELGHSWGLNHPWEFQNVWWDSVMNYQPKKYQLANLCADDTTAIRTTYPGIGIHDGLLSFYTTQDTVGSGSATYVEVNPDTHTYIQGDLLGLTGAYRVENLGTDNVVNPQIDVYLTHDRMSWAGAEYLQTLSYSLTIPPFAANNLTIAPFPISYYTPPGDYWLAFWLNDPSDAASYNNGGWNTQEFGRISILSNSWPINMYTFWQYQQVRTGPNGQYDFYFYEDAGDRVDISTCDADGGFADFDTILELKDPFAWQVAYSDDYCLLQSRISYRVQTTGTHHLMLRGYAGTFGTSRMQYRARSFGGTNLSLAATAQRAAGTVRLTWSGDSGPYDVERSTTPWFSSPVLVSTDGFGTTLDDPVLTNGVTYYYRAR